MSKTINATFDGSVFHPSEPVSLPANTSVRLTVETVKPSLPKTKSFLETARSLKLEGPPDWATNFEKYLRDEESRRAD